MTQSQNPLKSNILDWIMVESFLLEKSIWGWSEEQDTLKIKVLGLVNIKFVWTSCGRSTFYSVKALDDWLVCHKSDAHFPWIDVAL